MSELAPGLELVLGLGLGLVLGLGLGLGLGLVLGLALGLAEVSARGSPASIWAEDLEVFFRAVPGAGAAAS